MRLFLALALALGPILPMGAPKAALAEDFVLTIPVREVTVYRDGALVGRQADFTAPAGTHRLIFPDLPDRADADTLALRLGDRAITALAFRDRFVPPQDRPGASPEVARAEERVAEAERALAAQTDRIRALRTHVEAAEARMRYLAGITGEGGAETDPDRLARIGETIEAGIRAGGETALEAEIAIRGLQDARKPFEEELARAQQALAALRAPSEAGNRMIAEVTFDAPFEGPLALSYAVPGGAVWEPLHDVMLTRGESPKLEIRRGADVQQFTGENWDAVALSLSTLSLYGALSPARLAPRRLRITDPIERPPAPRAAGLDQSDSLSSVYAAPKAEAAIAAPEMLDGLGVTYRVPAPASIASDADRARIAFDTLELAVGALAAEAVPLVDSSAFLVAEATNTSPETILASGSARFHVDGVMVGQTGMEMIPSGGEARFGFGPIDGLRLERIVTDRNEGDRGVINRAVQQSEAARITVRNLTGRAWDLRIFDRVPFSEQEDLVIDWEATPMPTDRAVDGQRGILRWDRTLSAGGRLEIELETVLRYPEGKTLR